MNIGDEKTQSIVELIARIEKRPTMYLGKPYISCLRCYIDGWMVGMNDSVNDADKIYGFQKWIEQKYRIQTSHGWDSIILHYSAGEASALANFFPLFNEWLASEKGPKN